MAEAQVGRRGFLGRLLGALTGLATIPLATRQAAADSRRRRRWAGRSGWRGGYAARSGRRAYGGWGYGNFYRGYYAPAYRYSYRPRISYSHVYRPGYFYSPGYYYTPGYYASPGFYIEFQKSKVADPLTLLDT